jgi:putative CocE/NonD family hydrolase
MNRTLSQLRHSPRLQGFLLLALLIPLTIHPAFGQARPAGASGSLEYTRSHYTKYDFRIPMRDGLKLFTSVYAPKDRSKTYPILIQRTPYSVGPYGIDNYRASFGPSEAFAAEGFIFVYQDVRGRYLSEGVFVDVPFHKQRLDGPKDFDESTDTYDTIDWLVKNIPNNNGRAGIWGISYPGFYAAFSLINSHPALKAASPQAPMGDVGDGDDAYHNGAFFLAANFGFYTGFKPRGPNPERPRQGDRFDFGTPDAYDFYLHLGPLAHADESRMQQGNEYWTDMVKHPAYDDFWSARALAPWMKGVKAAVLFVGGWYDAEDLAGPLKLFRAVEKDGHARANTLVMGPWPHGGWSRGDGDKLGNLVFASKTGAFFREQIELPFFTRNLKSKRDGPKPAKDEPMPKAWVFETGLGEWRRFDAWPPRNARRRSLYPGPGGKLAFAAPDGEPDEYDEYVSDPAAPVPVTGEIGEGMPGDYMTHDQRFASRRTDVLTYQTEPLENDVTIAGPVTPVLRVSTSGTDSDFDVKLIDVFPNDYPGPDPNPAGVHMPGYQQLVRGEPFRGKYRNSRSHPEPFRPGEPAKIEFAMPDVLHTFRAGHRVMLQIQSSWFPLTDRNPQQFMDIPEAKAADFQKAVERVYRDGARGTRVEVLVVD